jgi:hypothetical protein
MNLNGEWLIDISILVSIWQLVMISDIIKQKKVTHEKVHPRRKRWLLS